MEQASQGVAREGALGLAATLGAANVAQLAGSSLTATGHLWMLRWSDFAEAPALAWRDVDCALIALAAMPAALCGAAACFWAVRLRGERARRFRHALGAAWAGSAALAGLAWLILRRSAQQVEPYPANWVFANIALTLALGVLPAWWLGQSVWAGRLRRVGGTAGRTAPRWAAG